MAAALAPLPPCPPPAPRRVPQTARPRRPAGRHRGTAHLTPHGSVMIEFEWGAPLAGRGTDELLLVDPDTLHVLNNTWVGDQEISYRLVYRRQK